MLLHIYLFNQGWSQFTPPQNGYEGLPSWIGLCQLIDQLESSLLVVSLTAASIFLIPFPSSLTDLHISFPLLSSRCCITSLISISTNE